MASGRLAFGIHRILQRLVPSDVRARHGKNIDDTFNDMYEAAAIRGRSAVARLLIDELVSAVRSRFTRRPGASSSAFHWRSFTHAIFAISPRFRALRRRPGFALGILATLALATGALTTIFAVVDTVLLRPLPYPESQQLLAVYESMPAKGQAQSLVAPARIADWQRMNRTLSGIAGSYFENVTDTSALDPERISAVRVTPGYFDVYGSAPLAGRTLSADEERVNGLAAIVVSEALARRRFGAPDAAVGQVLRIGGSAVPIVGVMPSVFAAATIDAWMPAQIGPPLSTIRNARFMNGVARMKRGVTVDQALADLSAVQAQLGNEFPATDKVWTVTAGSLAGWGTSASMAGLSLIFGAIALLWLIGVTNVAGLMVVELQRRARDLAVRAAIGASRAGIVGELVGEAVILSVIGTAAGIGLAALATPAIPRVITSLPRMNELALDTRAIAFAAATSAAAALIFGLWPALAATRRRAVTLGALGTRGGAAPRHALQSTLVIVQVAMSLLLVGSAGLLARSYINLTNVDAGFSANDVVTFRVGARWDEDRAKVGQFQATLVDALERTPGVTAAGFTNFFPMSGATLRSHVRVAGLPGRESDGGYSVGSRMVGRNYLSALSVPLKSGAWCRAQSPDPNAPREALVNKKFIDEFAPGESLVGRTLSFTQFANAPFTITGIVGDVVEDTPSASPVPYIYTCDSLGSWPDPSYVVRTSDPRAFIANARTIVRGLDASRAVFALRPLSDVTDQYRQSPRVNAALLSIFAAAAVLIASAGLYGLFARLVSDRAREIGVRLALGAAPAAIMRSIWSRAFKLILSGLLIGAVASAAATRVLAASLYRVSPLDPLTMIGAVGLLLIAGAVAVAVPALRAAHVDPVVTMRAD